MIRPRLIKYAIAGSMCHDEKAKDTITIVLFLSGREVTRQDGCFRALLQAIPRGLVYFRRRIRAQLLSNPIARILYY